MQTVSVGDTTNKLTVMLFNSYENPEPAATILNYLKTQDGKPITQRHITALQKLLPDYEIDLSRGHDTNIGWYGPAVNGIRPQRERLYLHSNPKGYVIDAADIEDRNGRHFGPLHERNRKRDELARNSHKLRQAAQAIHDYLRAKSAYGDAIQEISPISYLVDDKFLNQIAAAMQEEEVLRAEAFAAAQA